MKKIVMLVMAAALVFSAGSALAKNGSGGGGGGNGGGAGYGTPGMGNKLPADFSPVTAEKANQIANEYVHTYMNTYQIESVEEFEGRMFTGYKYTVKNTEGNTLTFIVNAKGEVRGPFSAQ